jgi:hypothetical protein
LSEFGNFFAYEVIICFDINNFLFNLVKERAAFKPLFFIVSEKDGEIGI